MTPMKALTPTRGIDPPEPGTQGVEPEADPAVAAKREIDLNAR
jgi:hypothetical protein